MIRRIRDAKIRNSYQTRQERLDRVDEILSNQEAPCVHSLVCSTNECPCEEYEEDSEYYFDDNQGA